MEFTGRITRNATVKQVKNDRSVVGFTIALNDYYKPKGSDKGKQFTTYINCSYWLSPAVASRLSKGSLVEVSGRIYVTAFKDMDGEPRASLNCHVNSIRIHQTGKANVTTPEPNGADGTGDLPF